MSSRVDPSFEQTTQLLDTLARIPAEGTSAELRDAATIVADLGNRTQEFSPADYVGLAVKRALDLR